MNSLRFLVVGVLFTLPLFAFAQTATTTAEQTVATTTAEQLSQTDKILLDQIDQLTANRERILSKIEDVRPSAVRDLLDIKISPSNPGPNATVRVTIESYLSDMNKATISWSINNKIVLSGIGKTSFRFQNGPSGKTTALGISIITNTGETITKKFSWTPVGITLFWEADTYTPPFYRGKPLLSPQANVKIVATPDNVDPQNAVGAGNFVYIWEKGGQELPNVSGYGKNSFSFVGPKPYDDISAKVRVSSIDNTIMSESRVYLPLSQPFILFYDKNPILGVSYNNPIVATLDLSKRDFSLVAEPYFFSNERGDTPTLKYVWSVNGAVVPNDGRSITLRNESGTKGSSDVSLSMRGIRQTFQTASHSLRVNFKENLTTSKPIF